MVLYILIIFNFKYNKIEEKIEEAFYVSGYYESLDYKYIYKYDGDGNQTELAKYNSNGALKFKWIYKYEYDSKDNWTKKVQFEVKNEGLNTPTNITEREIE